MRKVFKRVIILVNIIVMAFAMISCSVRYNESDRENTEIDIDVKESDYEDEIIDDKEDFSENKMTDDEEISSEDKVIDIEASIMKAFNEAEIAYSWFTGYGEIDFKGEEYTIEFNNQKYYEVDQNDIVTMNDLKDYLSKYFDDKTVDELMNLKADLYGEYDIFIDYEGKLYALGGYVHQISYTFAEKEFKIIKDNDSKYIISVDIKCRGVINSPEKSISYDYIYEKLNNKWIFTNYQLPAKYCRENGSEE